VAAQGLDANLCTFAQPCRTFQHAHNVVAAGGEIDVLDPPGYGSGTISKSISIQGHGFSGIRAPAGADAGTVNARAGDVVSLNGLLLEGGGVGAIGVRLLIANSLIITNSVVRKFLGSGIGLSPTGQSRIVVSNTLVAHNGQHGIYLQSNSGGAKAVFS